MRNARQFPRGTRAAKVMLDSLDLDPAVYAIMARVEARGGFLAEAYHEMVAAGFAGEASQLVVALFEEIAAKTGKAH